MATPSLCKISLAIYVLAAICYGQECDPNGVSCINCGEYRQCSGGLPTGPIFSCRKGVECGEEHLLDYCWNKLNCYALNECTDVGIFPDAMVESNFFVCLPDVDSGFIKYDFACGEEEFFDETSRMCISRLATSEESPSENTPTMTPSPPTTTPIPSPPTTTPTPSPPPTTPTPSPTTTPTTPPSLVCKSSGIFPNPDNCKMYFRCSTSLKIFHYICPGASYFNEHILKCSLSVTLACQEQILQNITTSTTPTTTTTLVSTPPPLTSTTPTPTHTPSTTFACSTAGTFENPLDCKTFYRCSSTGKSFLYVCPGDSYYNELTQRCGLIITPKCRSKLRY